jgi:hypothetical protein
MSAFTLKTSIRHSCLFELLPLNIILGVLARVNKQENEIKSNHIVAEEAILSSFAEDTILNIDSHKEFTQTFRSNRQAVQVYLIKVQIILSEVSLAQKTKNRMFSLICGHQIKGKHNKGIGL